MPPCRLHHGSHLHARRAHQRFTVLVVAALVTISACDASSDVRTSGEVDAGGQDAAMPASCVQADSDPCAVHIMEDVCLEAASCEAIYGRGGAPATSPTLFRGCRNASLECSPAIRYGRERGEGDGCIQFDSTCLPSGWECLGADPCSAFCHQFGAQLSSCEATAGCTPVFGRLQFASQPSYAGCIPTPARCDDTPGCGRSPDGVCRAYTDSCMPADTEPEDCHAPRCPEEPIEAMLADCSITTVMAHVAGDAETLDCGNITLEDAVASREAAFECLAESQAQGIASRAVIQEQGIDSIVRTGTLGLVEQGELVVYSLFFDSFNTASTTWSISHVVNLEGDCPAAGDRCIRAGALLDDNPHCRCVESVEENGAGYVFCSRMP
jgi:hypothetical protein